MKTTEPPVVVTQVFNASSEQVWNALTQLDQMGQWYFTNIPAFEPKVGFQTQFVVESGGRSFPHLWKILEIIPKQKMVQEWKYVGYDGVAHVTFELEAIDKKTKLRVTATVLEDFTDDIPDFQRESCLGGWQYFIQQNLKKYFGG